MRRPLALVAAAVAALLLLASASGGTFSGTNGDIGFTCGSAICISNPSGSSVGTLIQSGPGAVSNPDWSADGQKIVYQNGNDIWTANADGSNKQLFRSGAMDPSWSPDNSTIAFMNSSDSHIWTRNSTTSTQITTGTGTDFEPAFSPDGTKIVYASVASGDTVSHLWIVTVSPTIGTPVELTSGNDDESPSWSPDGSKIVFDENGALFTVPSSGGAATALAGLQGYDPSYSPDGLQISYEDASTGHLYVVNADGSNPHAINTTLSVSDTNWGTATTTAGSGSGGSGPTNQSYPTITLASGDTTPVVGHSLFASVGSWSGTFPIKYAYQWKRCDPSDPVNGPCVDIASATSSVYAPVPADYGFRLRVQVTATDSTGSTAQNSEVTAPVTAIAAKVTATPQITPGGQNEVDQQLSLTAGAWAGSTPIAYTYSWRRCDPVGDLSSCVAISGATSSTYTPTTADIGFSLRVWITGTNLAGSDVAITNHTYPIVDKPHFAPTVATAPAIAGVALPGRQLTADIGTYSGDAPITTSFQWYRCDATGASCHLIASARKVVYFPTAADVGYTLRLAVSATNQYGHMVAQSDPTDTVQGEPPHVKGKRIVGTARADYLAGGGHDDTIFGLGGNDTILGGAGDDRLYGGAGNDVITGGPGRDMIYGGAGSDTIYAADGERDIIDCGPGNDHAYVDSVDIVKNCEVVTVVQPSGSGSGSTGGGTGTGGTGTGLTP